jgi:Glycosyltransferase Family 4
VNILFTNNRIDARGGTAPFLKQWSEQMQALGHTVTCYSTQPPQARRAFEAYGLPVTEDLDRLTFVPDIIHGQHHMDAMSALLAFPDVPAVYFSHGGVWQECPPVHPRIYEYLVVTPTAAERMAVEFNIPMSSIQVFPNSLELARWPALRRLPDRPSRALFFNHRHTPDSPTARMVQAAAASTGLSLDIIGNVQERWIARPEDVLPTYDIVFASGVSAMEAIASGCAVVVVGRTSCGEMVLPENYQRFRANNFTIAVNSAPPDAAFIEAQLRRYSAEACARVSAQLRQEADHRIAMPKLEELYRRVIERHRTTRPEPRAELEAISRYLQGLSSIVALTDERMSDRGRELMGGRVDQDVQIALAQIDEELSSGIY